MRDALKKVTYRKAVILLIFFLFCILIIRQLLPNNHRITVEAYYKNAPSLPMIVEGNRNTIALAEVDGVIYAPLDEGLIYTQYFTPENSFLETADREAWYRYPLNVAKEYVYQADVPEYKPATENVPEGIPYRTIGKKKYISLKLLERFSPFLVKTEENPHRIVLLRKSGEQQQAVMKTNVKARIRPTHRGDILRDLREGESVLYLRDKGSYAELQLPDGPIVYVKKKDVQIKTVWTEIENPSLTTQASIPVSEIRMGYHQTLNNSGRTSILKLTENNKVLTDVAVTWISLRGSGELSSRADGVYVADLKKRGIRTHIVIDNFNEECNTSEFLRSREARFSFIRKVREILLSTGAFGVQLDFEKISARDASYYHLFVKELSSAVKRENRFFSIALPPLVRSNAHMNRGELDYRSDALVLMAYDEYYAGKETAGPTSSLPFVKDGILKTRRAMQSKNLIVALPFYDRLWIYYAKGYAPEGKGKETEDPERKTPAILVSRAIGMKDNDEIMKQYNLKAELDPVIGLKAASADLPQGRACIWVEDVDTLKLKKNLVDSLGSYGYAFWKLGLEDEKVWTLWKN